MANFQGFGEILGSVSRSILTSALNAAANSTTRTLDSYAVHEISGKANMDEVSICVIKDNNIDTEGSLHN